MARTRDPERLERILAAATEAFVNASYRSVGMAEIARRAELAPGTLYLYAANKETLFYWVLRHAIEGQDFVFPGELPLGIRDSAAILAFVRKSYETRIVLQVPEAADTRPPAAGVAAEVEHLVRNLYRLVARYRIAIRVLERSAVDWPELFDLQFRTIRRGLLSRLAGFLEQREKQGHLHPIIDGATAARVVLENVAWFAMHRHHSPDSAYLRDDLAEETVVQLLVRALAKEPAR